MPEQENPATKSNDPERAERREGELEKKMVFAVSASGQNGDGVPVLLLGIPAGAWEHMREGETHTFDLARIGFPVKMMLFGGPSHESVLATVKEVMRGWGVEKVQDLRDTHDFAMHQRKMAQSVVDHHPGRKN
jgi:hypothetical protein